MARMIDLVRNSQLPSYMMNSAVRGALRVPPEEMIEIMVYLALHNRVFGEQARMTLAGWDEKSSRAVAADPRTNKEVLDYFISPKNLRPALLPTLLENPSVRTEPLMELAESGSREMVEALLASQRVKSSPALLQSLRLNANLRPKEIAEVERRLTPLGDSPPPVPPLATAEAEPEGDNQQAEESEPVAADPEVVDERLLTDAIQHYLKENEEELAAEADKPFQPVRMGQEGAGTEAEAKTELDDEAPAADAAPAVKSETGRVTPAAAAKKKPVVKEDRRDSTLQKIAKLDIKGRIALAMRGNKEERSLLIRDGTKLVALAVLDSPKVSDGEVENFAQQKNVLEAVLRAIPLRRKYAKNYAITRNLVYNPRTPLDLSLGLMKNLLIHDLKNLSGNKEVSDTIRKLALRMFKQKSEKKG